MIEHLRMAPNQRWFREAFRVLESGGKIRLSTPDVGRLARIYLDDEASTTIHLDRARDSGYEAHHPVDLLRIVFQEAGHHKGYLWDLASLANELRYAGFVDVERVQACHSEDPHLRGLEARPGLQDSPVDLTIEARKP